MRCTDAPDAGSYVLGALAPAERETYEGHLARCPACRQEVAQLAVLPGLMARLDAPTAEAIAREGNANALPTAPETLLPQVLDAARARQARRRRRRTWVSLAAGLAAACLAVVVAIPFRAPDRQPRVPAQPSDSAPALVYTAMKPAVNGDVPITAEVALVRFSGGTQVMMHCTYRSVAHDPERWTLRLVVYPRWGGDAEEIASWTAGDGDDLTLPGYTRLSPSEIRRVEVRWEKVAVLAYDVP